MSTTARRRRAQVTSSRSRLDVKSLPEDARRHNRRLVLRHLFHEGPQSRADIARASGLTRVTVSDLVAGLEEDGLVVELGPRTIGSARPGKPAMLVGLADEQLRVLAIDLSPDDCFVGAVMTLHGQVQHRVELPLAGMGGDEALEQVLALIGSLADAVTVRVLGIGVGTPGIVTPEGKVREAPNLRWYELDLAARIRSRFDYPVHVANDANAAVLGVRTFESTHERSLMVVRIEHGVGAGLIVGGALVEGEQFAAGEIGHVVVSDEGLCACGRVGCLEVALAASQLKRRIGAGEDRDQVLSGAGTALGVALAPIISALNLNEVIVSGPAELVGGVLTDTARATVRANTMSAVSNGLVIRPSTDDINLVLLGATELVLSGELGVE
ncbi:Sugar kinase of the NBD/HSP70 family, may contain an N-terminal HTH domain [Propionibacterium cyclohexanicum]|uniref:Sugar kinase of the NBD/HSP70 family, may contain an N-terminal HTH domain n=1 Tax=Propionibacterium cyclohexanicum TaxID=64702 RepID=A0A1H9TGQ3_9ACTN|nr:ROK family transcriptional regulator [Propionibacterium cyclohexanicum]SER96382.1 Sugar kinase of the NBD/HSP70 family, may contain an N-terminal HTH domain [Propionibacterium cyclohexanicum]